MLVWGLEAYLLYSCTCMLLALLCTKLSLLTSSFSYSLVSFFSPRILSVFMLSSPISSKSISATDFVFQFIILLKHIFLLLQNLFLYSTNLFNLKYRTHGLQRFCLRIIYVQFNCHSFTQLTQDRRKLCSCTNV